MTYRTLSNKTGPESIETSPRGRRLVLVAAVATVILQLWGLYSPGDLQPKPDLFVGADKVAHLLIFAIPTGLLLRAGLRRAVVVALMGAQAVLSEIAQGSGLVPHRSGDVADALADVLGIAVGVWLSRGRH